MRGVHEWAIQQETAGTTTYNVLSNCDCQIYYKVNKLKYVHVLNLDSAMLLRQAITMWHTLQALDELEPMKIVQFEVETFAWNNLRTLLFVSYIYITRADYIQYGKFTYILHACNLAIYSPFSVFHGY